jgi:hypothetical protein
MVPLHSQIPQTPIFQTSLWSSNATTTLVARSSLSDQPAIAHTTGFRKRSTHPSLTISLIPNTYRHSSYLSHTLRLLPSLCHPAARIWGCHPASSFDHFAAQCQNNIQQGVLIARFKSYLTYNHCHTCSHYIYLHPCFALHEPMR